MYINLTIAREPAQIIVRNLLYLDIYITIISKYDVGGFNVAKNIDAKLKNIQGIFSNSQDSILGQDGCFIIPDYQRAYNWRFNGNVINYGKILNHSLMVMKAKKTKLTFLAR